MSKALHQASNEAAASIIDRIRAKHGIGHATPAPVKTAQEKAKAAKAETKSKPAPAPRPAPTPKAVKVPKEMPLCACECGGRTKGGRYLPGHDSKHRSALAGPKVMPKCKCGCGGETRGGTFLPGHDAKYHSMLRKQEKELAEAATSNKKSNASARKPSKKAVSAVQAAA